MFFTFLGGLASFTEAQHNKGTTTLFAQGAFAAVNPDIVFDVVNPLTTKGFPIVEYNRLALDIVKAMSASTAVKALT